MNYKRSILYVGLDVHKNTITFAVFKDNKIEPFIVTTKRNDKTEIKKYFEKLKQQGVIICCYEAGPSGFELYRFLTDLRIQCIVAAPSLLPKKPGGRIKNDKRDAKDLAKALRNNDITSVYIPKVKDEAVRDYIRMRGDFKIDLKRKKQQLLSFLLRHDRKYNNKGQYWTQKHRKWIKAQEFTEIIYKDIVNEYYIAIIDLEDKIKRLDEKILEMSNKEEYVKNVSKLRCFKGIDTLTALSLVVEISDFRRFSKAEQIMGYLGLTPSEDSSGDKRRLGSITKCGNSYLRRLLIESSWHYRYYNNVSTRLSLRRRNQPSELIAYADKAGRRLNKKFHKLILHNKSPQVAVTAVARELSGFIWGMMTNNI